MIYILVTIAILLLILVLANEDARDLLINSAVFLVIAAAVVAAIVVLFVWLFASHLLELFVGTLLIVVPIAAIIYDQYKLKNE